MEKIEYLEYCVSLPFYHHIIHIHIRDVFNKSILLPQNRIETEQNQFFVLSELLDYRLNINEMIHI